jgi:hypothetical protein
MRRDTAPPASTRLTVLTLVCVSRAMSDKVADKAICSRNRAPTSNRADSSGIFGQGKRLNAGGIETGQRNASRITQHTTRAA